MKDNQVIQCVECEGEGYFYGIKKNACLVCEWRGTLTIKQHQNYWKNKNESSKKRYK